MNEHHNGTLEIEGDDEVADILGFRWRRHIGETQRRCMARNKQGNPCGRWAMTAQAVCDRHGGKAPGALRAANERVLTAFRALLPAALQKVAQALSSPAGACPHCGRSDSLPAELRAALAVFDRTGFHAHSTLEIEPPRDESDLDALSDDELDAEEARIQAKIAQIQNEPHHDTE